MKFFLKRGESYLIYFSIILFSLNPANALILYDSSTNFLNGTFNNTNFVNNSVQLNQSFSGTFTSRVLFLNKFFSTTNISMNFIKPFENSILVVDTSADIWKSQNKGVSWSLIEDDYNDDSNNPKSMTIDNNNFLYIVEADDDIWKSSNLGLNWTKINDNYDNVPLSNGASLFLFSDNDNSLFIVEKDEDIWRSDNQAINWTRVNHTDFNYKNGDVAGYGIIYNKPFLADKNSDIWFSDNKGRTWILVKDDYNGAESNYIIAMTNDKKFLINALQKGDSETFTEKEIEDMLGLGEEKFKELEKVIEKIK